VFGVLGIEMGKKHSELFKMSAETQLFGVFNHLLEPEQVIHLK
jgi:glycine betaine transporter